MHSAPVKSQIVYEEEGTLECYLTGEHGKEADANGFFSITDTITATPNGRHRHPDFNCCAEETHEMDSEWTKKDDRQLEVGAYRHKYHSITCFFIDDVAEADPQHPIDKAARWNPDGVKEAHKNTEAPFCYIGAFKGGLPHGKGVFVYEGRTIYDGAWKDGKAHIVGRRSTGAEPLRRVGGASLLTMAKDAARMFSAEWRGVRTAEKKWEVQERRKADVEGGKGEADVAGEEDEAPRVTTCHDPATDLPVDFPWSDHMCDWFQEAATACNPDTGLPVVWTAKDPWTADADGNESEWKTPEFVFPRHWVFGFRPFPYYGHSKLEHGEDAAPRWESLSRMRVGTNTSLVHDPHVALHDTGKWSNLEDFLTIGALIELEWKEDPCTGLGPNRGVKGRFIAAFDSRGKKYENCCGWWEVGAEWVEAWIPKIAEACRDNPNETYEVSNVEDEESASTAAYLAKKKIDLGYKEDEVWAPLRNKPGMSGGGELFVECNGRTAKAAKDAGWELLEFEERSGYVTNFSKIFWNPGSLSNEFLFKTGSQAAADRTKPTPTPLTAMELAWNVDAQEEQKFGEEGNDYAHGHMENEYAYSKKRDLVFATLNERQNEHPEIYGPTIVFVENTYNEAELERIMRLPPYKWYDFSTGKRAVAAPSLIQPDCVVDAMAS
jgi:hypothetical protein